MTCPRCGGDLETYRLNGEEATSCRECGYADSPVSHEGRERRRESWDAALERFMDSDQDERVDQLVRVREERDEDDADAASG